MVEAQPHPRTTAQIRDWIVDEAARALRTGREAIDTTAPLDALGVDSLSAIGMAGGLAGFLGRDVPATVMWDYTSIDAMAEALADAPTALPPGVVPLQPVGQRRPIFFFPGLGGHPASFMSLASYLAPDHPCFGLTVPGLDGQSDAMQSVADIVEVMIGNLRRVQAVGPYQLAGYSFGGYLAFEAARQLEGRGETTSLLAIFDTFTPAGLLPRPLWQRLAVHAQRLVTRKGRLDYLRGRLRNIGSAAAAHVDTETGEPAADAMLKDIQRSNGELVKTFKPGTYSGGAVFFEAAQRADYAAFSRYDELGGWAEVCGGGVHKVAVPGTHLTMLNAGHAPAAADALRPFLV